MSTLATLAIFLLFMSIPASFVWWVRKKEIKIEEARRTAYISDQDLIEKYETRTTAELLIERQNIKESIFQKQNEKPKFNAESTKSKIQIQAIDEVLLTRGIEAGKHYYK